MKTLLTFLFLLLINKLFSLKVVKSLKDRKFFTNLWHKIWIDEHYAKPDESIVAKYAKYDSFSVDFLVKFLWIFPVGTMRLIPNNSSITIPTLDNFEIDKKWKFDKVVEVTLLTVKRRFRGLYNFPLMILMKSLYQYSKKEKIKGLIVAADVRLFKFLTRIIKLPFIQIGPEKFYEGSITVPAYMSFQNFEEIFRKNNPRLAEFIFK